MLTKEENEFLTQVGPGTPCGDLMRRFWQPVALQEELPLGGAPLPVRILGEDLVLYRNDQGRPGLLGLHCSHRGADLSYGRVEDGGLRCIYHGWLYDLNGRCLEQPGEPAGSTFHDKIAHPSYPCVERAKMILAYLGPGEPPLVPNFEFLNVPDDQVLVTKVFHECNYLQANEGNIDFVHLSFLHAIMGRGTILVDKLAGGGAAPHLERFDAQITPFGVRVCRITDLGDKKRLFVGTYIPPNAFAFGSNNDGYSVNWHVPVDDENHCKYILSFNRKGAVPGDRPVARGLQDLQRPSYRMVHNRANRYLQDRSTMDTIYTGIGGVDLILQGQDLWATESQGAIQDRTSENLSPSDVGIIATRQALREAIKRLQTTGEAPYVVRTSEENHFPYLLTYGEEVPLDTDWKERLHEVETTLATEPTHA